MKRKGGALASLILLTLVSLGPIGWFFVDLLERRYDRLIFLFVASIIVTAICAAFWTAYFCFARKADDADDDLDEIDGQ